MAQNLRVGGEIDAFCTRCKMLLAHTILAMVGSRPARVQCNTCGGQHNFRGAPDAPAPNGASAAAEPRPERARVSFEQAMASKTGPGKRYTPKERFLLDEVVLHPTFGRGYVAVVRQDKIDIVFKAGTKTLVHGRG